MATYLAIKHAVFGDFDTLTTAKITKRSDLKGLDVQAMDLFRSISSYTTRTLQRVGERRQESSTRPSVEMYVAVPPFERSRSSGITSVESVADLGDEESLKSPSVGPGEDSLDTFSASVGYKANCQVVCGSKAFVTSQTPFFRIRSLNVASGDMQLFSGDGLSLEIRKGEILSVEGCSGIGKTRYR